jgi:hypothetical protein
MLPFVNMIFIAAVSILLWKIMPSLVRRKYSSTVFKLAVGVVLLQAVLFILILIVATAFGIQSNPDGFLWQLGNLLVSAALAPGQVILVTFVPFFGFGGLLLTFIPILVLNLVFWYLLARIVFSLRMKH